MPTDFQIEQNKVLETGIKYIFDLWKQPVDQQINFLTNNTYSDEYFLEFYVTPNCNQACEYCYLQKNKDLIYPKEYRDNNQIINNLRIMLDYLLDEQIKLPRIDLFSGEIWGYPLGNKVFDCLIEAMESGLIIKKIIIPSNCSFCANDQLLKIIENYIDIFNSLDCHLCFSISMDGFVTDLTSRPFINPELNKDVNYFNNIKKFAKKYHFGFHPMISAHNLDNQKENYDAWIATLQELYPDSWEKEFGSIMQLEVRNDEWTDENIIKYLDWLNYLLDKDIELFFKNDLIKAAKYILLGERNMEMTFPNSYFPYYLLSSNYGYNCTLNSMFCVRLGDLGICPCHRTSYDKFMIGKFVVENNKIIGVEANNIQIANAVWRTGGKNKPKCDSCFWNGFCLRGCLGAQYESTGEIFFPCPTVCQQQIAKIIFCIEKFKQLDFFNKIDMHYLNPVFKTLLTDYEKTEEYKKWKPIIQKLLYPN